MSCGRKSVCIGWAAPPILRVRTSVRAPGDARISVLARICCDKDGGRIGSVAAVAQSSPAQLIPVIGKASEMPWMCYTISGHYRTCVPAALFI